MTFKSEIKKPGIWLSILGIGVSALGSAKNWPELIWIGVGIVFVTLIAIWIDRERKVRKLKIKVSSLTKTKNSLEVRVGELKSFLESLSVDGHNAAHSLRDTLSDLRLITEEKEAKARAGLCISELLSQASHCMSKITNCECVCSLMLHAGGSLRTYQYSANAPNERTGRMSKALDPNKGIAGKAFQTGDVVFWNKGDPFFVEIRENGEQFYESGMTVPFRVGYDYAGLLNIDAKSQNVFKGQCHRMLGALFADAIGAASEGLYLWQEMKK